MTRYYVINVDMRNGADVPEKICNSEYSAKKCFADIKLSKTGVVYKSMYACTDDGDKFITSEEVEI